MKKKIIFFIAGLSLAFSFLFLWANHLTVFHSQTEQKTLFARKVSSRVNQIIENEKKRIATLCADWAAWDSMYAYIENPTREFEREASPAAVVRYFDLSLILISDNNGNVLYHHGFDRKSNRDILFNLQNVGRNRLGRFFQDTFPRPDMESFIVASEFGPLLAISAPITRSDGSGSSPGRLLMGRLFDPAFNDAIGAAIQEKSTLLSPSQLAADSTTKEFLVKPSREFLLKEGKNHLEILNPFTDPEGQLVFAVRVDAGRAIFALQENAMLYFLLSLFLSTLMIGLLFYAFIDRMLLKRLQDISAKTTRITTFEDLSVRIPEERRDEITRLSRNINLMLERLENENIRHREMERRLVMNEKLIATGRLAANIAHEINNPLFAISNSLAVIKKQLRTSSGDAGEVMPLAEKEIKRVRKITRKLLDYGKINLETFRESDIDSIMDTACEVLKLSKQVNGTVIARGKKGGAAPIFCNPDSLQQVFMNLILNASEAMNGRGEISIEVVPSRDAYEVHFRDTGPGFPTSVKKRIFEPFNSSKETKGAGLGLYISYHIVKRHGGNMILDEKSGSGAHLVVTLPRRGGVENHD